MKRSGILTFYNILQTEQFPKWREQGICLSSKKKLKKYNYDGEEKKVQIDVEQIRRKQNNRQSHRWMNNHVKVQNKRVLVPKFQFQMKSKVMSQNYLINQPKGEKMKRKYSQNVVYSTNRKENRDQQFMVGIPKIDIREKGNQRQTMFSQRIIHCQDSSKQTINQKIRSQIMDQQSFQNNQYQKIDIEKFPTDQQSFPQRNLSINQSKRTSVHGIFDKFLPHKELQALKDIKKLNLSKKYRSNKSQYSREQTIQKLIIQQPNDKLQTQNAQGKSQGSLNLKNEETI